jgi:hypothetical protein
MGISFSLVVVIPYTLTIGTGLLTSKEDCCNVIIILSLRIPRSQSFCCTGGFGMAPIPDFFSLGAAHCPFLSLSTSAMLSM